MRLECVRRHFPTPLPGPGALHVPLAEAIAKGPRVRHHDDDALASHTEGFDHNRVYLLAIEVFEYSTAEHQIDRVGLDRQGTSNVRLQKATGQPERLVHCLTECQVGL